MRDIEPMFHMDEDWMWRWWITSGKDVLAVSARSFFTFDEARRDYDRTMRSNGLAA